MFPPPARRDDANAIRALAMDAVDRAKSGHPGMPMGMADVASVLFRSFLKFDAADPHWPNRDRFVLSAGRGSMLLYALGYLVGYPGMEIEDSKIFRQLGSKTAGHPEYRHAPGVETTTGPLGQGLTTAVGMAIGERLANARFGDAIVDHFTYVIAGDGCLMEGISHEAIDSPAICGLASSSCSGTTITSRSTGRQASRPRPIRSLRFEASGWHVQKIDGHDFAAVAAALNAAKEDPRPSMIACRTVIGFGAPNKQGKEGVHGSPLGAEENALARKALGWDYPPFEVPQCILEGWRLAAPRRTGAGRMAENFLRRRAKKEEFTRFLRPMSPKPSPRR